MRGKFLVFDGGDGAGKSTTIEVVARRLGALGIAHAVTREPGGTVFAEQLRQVLLSPGPDKLSAGTEFFLLWSARVDHIERRIIPALKKGKHVLCDRFDPSTYAYQIVGRDGRCLLPIFRQLRHLYVTQLRPHYLMFDLSPEVGIARRMGAGQDTVTRFDAEKLAFHQVVHEGYAEFERLFPGRYHHIDASPSAASVADTVFRKVLDIIGPIGKKK